MLRAQVFPPSNEAPARLPSAPPSDQRSCCQTPTMLAGLRGLIATIGSTSALEYSTPVGAVPSHPAANGVAAEARTWTVVSGGFTAHMTTWSGPYPSALYPAWIIWALIAGSVV